MGSTSQKIAWYARLVSPDMILHGTARGNCRQIVNRVCIGLPSTTSVRAQITLTPENYFWSSAGYHLRRQSPPDLLKLELWQAQWSFETWREALRETDEEEAPAVHLATQKGVPLGSGEFIGLLEENTGRSPGVRAVRRPKLCLDTTLD